MNEAIRRHLAGYPRGIEVLQEQRQPVSFDLLIWRLTALPLQHCRVVAQFDPDNAPLNEAELVMRIQAAATAWIRTEDGRAVADYAGGSPNFGDIINHGPSALIPYIDGCISFGIEDQAVSMKMSYDTELGDPSED